MNDKKINAAKLKIYEKLLEAIGETFRDNQDHLSFIKAKKEVLAELGQLRKTAAAAILDEIRAETEGDAQQVLINGSHLKDDVIDIQFVKERLSTEPKAPKWIVGDFAFATFEYDQSFGSFIHRRVTKEKINEYIFQLCELVVPASVPDCTCDSKALVSYGCQCDYKKRKLAKKI